MSLVNTSRKPVKVQAREWLFPLAAAYGVLMLPLSVLGMLGYLPVPAGLQTPFGHAHEMLFGMAFLVVSGYLLGPMPKPQLLGYIALWLLARIGFLAWPFSLPVMLFAAAGAALLSYWVVPRFWRAKKWRNQSVAPIIILFSIATTLAGYDALVLHRLLAHGLLVLAALMFFMGGRVIAPTLASFWLQQNIRMENRVQPNLEGAGLISLTLALLLQVLDATALLQALALGVAGVVVWLRLLRWQPWRYWRRLDILWLFFGYASLGTALLLLAAGAYSPLAGLVAIHTLTVGAMGVLMVSIMARVTVVKRFKDANAVRSSHLAAALLVIGALLRIFAPVFPAAYLPLVHSAMLCWSLGFASLIWVFWQCR